MRIGLLTKSGYPYAAGEGRVWCDRLVRGLAGHEFDVYALSGSARQEELGWVELPPQVRRVRTAPTWSAEDDGRSHGRRERRRFAEHYGDLAAAVCGADEDLADRFRSGLYGLAELAREHGGLTGALRSETAVRALEAHCRAPGARRSAHAARVPDLLAVAARLERALRPLSLDWYDEESLGAVDLCHAASGGAAALPGLLAKRFFGVPLLLTEYGVRLRAHYLTPDAAAPSPPVRALIAAFHGRLATEIYHQAALITPGNSHARRWQVRCGADPARLRTVYPGMDNARFAAVAEARSGTADDGEAAPEANTLVWVGRVEPAKDLIALLHAFAEVRGKEPTARLRVIGAPAADPESAAYLAHCRSLAAHLFPDEAADAHAVGENPVSFEEIGDPEAPDLADAYAGGSVVVLPSVVEGFPVSLVEAMLCGRATVSTDVGAVVEVIGGTGLVVPPRNPRALAEACVSLLRDPERRARLGAAALARARELFTVEQNTAAFRGIYLELMSRCPVRRDICDGAGDPLLFAHPAEVHVPGPWAVRPQTTEAGPPPAAAPVPEPRPAGTASGRAPGPAPEAPPVSAGVTSSPEVSS
ncbi:DUF3492 domain-containing protein [Streptomyces sp. GC420]|uniref:DUF3492 domain-containing protein n=1 Tax=Streptomyces sp. GC420 TaxID=2697568 RepID=UPI001415118A|nr:DUF3492 domain-containing protein [Streptomyces sp. GC420]NBM20448.1 DUF3492 domain-containing protein [Streptomyces sp. GC420]